MSRVYTTGVFDLFHVGHLRSLQAAKALGAQLIVGVHLDETAAAYKRVPIIPYAQRCEIIRALSCVDEVIEAPLYTTQQFYAEHQISIHVQGEDHPGAGFYADGLRLGIMRFIGRQDVIDSTHIIKSIIHRNHSESINDSRGVELGSVSN